MLKRVRESAAVLCLCLSLLPGSTALAQESPSEHWFEVDALNPGLGAVPPHLDRSTPRQTVVDLRRLTQAQAGS
ncbi:MAG TPA: hypothetical protein VKO38_02160, partial [Wenzhouxiangella sp.]|nr:hypothetical protein [Wenzhouxiangella sp.]